jgi:hypothetical protein
MNISRSNRFYIKLFKGNQVVSINETFRNQIFISRVLLMNNRNRFGRSSSINERIMVSINETYRRNRIMVSSIIYERSGNGFDIEWEIGYRFNINCLMRIGKSRTKVTWGTDFWNHGFEEFKIFGGIKGIDPLFVWFRSD